MQQVTTKKFAEMCNVSDANIRRLISTGKLNANKEPNGGYVLDIEDKSNREYLDSHKSVAKQEQVVTQSVAKQNLQAETGVIERLAQQIEILAKQAGKAELLTDNIIQKEQDAKYWQDKFFELQNTCETLRAKNNKLKEDIQKEQKRPFWQRNVF